MGRFGGATAYPKAKGIWRDNERGGALVKDEPVVVHCYTTAADVQNSGKLAHLDRDKVVAALGAKRRGNVSATGGYLQEPCSVQTLSTPDAS